MADTNSIRVRLVTPERVLFESTAASVELPGRSGAIEVLYGHAPLLTELGAGDVKLHGAGENGAGGDAIYNVSWGFAEVLPERVTILANDALKPGEIDVERAKEQLERGNTLWSQAGESEAAYDKALSVIAEAEAKLATAAEKH